MSHLTSRLEDFPNQSGGVCPKRVSVLTELEQVQLPFPGLDFADEGMGPVEPPREFALRDAGGFAGRLQCGDQCLMTRGAKVPAHRCPQIRGTKVAPSPLAPISGTNYTGPYLGARHLSA